FACVLNDVAGTVTIADIDVAVRRNGQIRGAVFQRLAVWTGLRVNLGFLRITKSKYFLAVQRGFDDDATLDIAEIEEFVLAFLVDVEAMRAAPELLAPALDELTFVIEDHHAVRLFAGGIDGVVDINTAVRVLADAMRVAVFDVRGEIAPIVGDFIGVIARAEDRLLTAGFIGGSEDQRRAETGTDSGEKRATGRGHVNFFSFYLPA